jgi:L-rhamnose isomerase/sugar isomerase
MDDAQTKAVHTALDQFEMELPSWGFADTGTRFGKYLQDAAADTIEQKIHDVGVVHRLTGAAPRVAVHVEWDFKAGQDPTEVAELAGEHGLAIGSINPTLFTDQRYKFGSLASPDAEARRVAMEHCRQAIEIGGRVGSRAMTVWLADGTNYPGQDNLRTRKHRLHEAFSEIHDTMARAWLDGTLLIEYKPFEPAFYHTDVADWGMSYAFCRHAGANAKVLVDTGHHLPGANIEHIVAFLLDEKMLGGFHFNDRKYADDDLTMGSIDPYGAFRIFDQIAQYAEETTDAPRIEYMVDQAHNLKPKLEAMVQTVCEAQKLRARAALVDRQRLAQTQAATDVVAAERSLREAFETDPTPAIQQWRRERGLAEDPLQALRESGLIDQLAEQRAAARADSGQQRNTSYA